MIIPSILGLLPLLFLPAKTGHRMTRPYTSMTGPQFHTNAHKFSAAHADYIYPRHFREFGEEAFQFQGIPLPEEYDLPPSHINLDTFPYHDRWMSVVPDDTLLSEMSIPGSHHSCAMNKQSQYLTLTDQFKSGIRVLDIRLCHMGSALWIYHGPDTTAYTLARVFQEAREFLDKEPTETLLVIFKMECEIGQDLEPIGKIFYRHVLEAGMEERIFRPDILTSFTVPTLGQVRGKIFMISNILGLCGYPYSNMKVNEGDFNSTELKESASLDYLAEAARGDRNQFVISYFSGPVDGINTETVAYLMYTNMQKHMRRYLFLDNNPPENTMNAGNMRLGIVMMDFVQRPDFLCAEIIKQNVHRHLKGAPIVTLINKVGTGPLLLTESPDDHDRKALVFPNNMTLDRNMYWALVEIRPSQYVIFNTYFRTVLAVNLDDHFEPGGLRVYSEGWGGAYETAVFKQEEMVIDGEQYYFFISSATGCKVYMSGRPHSDEFTPVGCSVNQPTWLQFQLWKITPIGIVQ